MFLFAYLQRRSDSFLFDLWSHHSSMCILFSLQTEIMMFYKNLNLLKYISFLHHPISAEGAELTKFNFCSNGENSVSSDFEENKLMGRSRVAESSILILSSKGWWQ